MQNTTISIENLEQEMYQALLAEIPDLPPYVARGLAKTAADNARQLRAANEKTVTAYEIGHLQNRRKFPDEQNHENDQT